MTGRQPRPSVQLQRYLQARRFGHDRASSAEFAGIPIKEAELIDQDEERQR